jgi:hypothetical protein
MMSGQADDAEIQLSGFPDRSRSAHRWKRHLGATASWLVESLRHGGGGSCAYYSPLGGWSRAYPETSGYLIPTLIALAQVLPGLEGRQAALRLGEWLLSIQREDGSWHGGLHPPRRGAAPSVFNTAQVLRGLVALHDLDADSRWLEAAERAGSWLAGGLDETGVWPHRDYRAAATPSYYTYAAAPMLMVADRCGDAGLRNAAQRVLDAILGRRRPNGAFDAWGFSTRGPAFTHTIAYTLQGLQEAAGLLGDWDRYGQPAERGLRVLAQHATATQGRLAGRFDGDWAPSSRFVCLTGNAQLALALLDLERHGGGQGLVDAAALLTGAICDAQRLRAPLAGIRGAVGGSAPVWGRYMMLRYPNWAAKYHCDALVELLGRSGSA